MHTPIPVSTNTARSRLPWQGGRGRTATRVRQSAPPAGPASNGNLSVSAVGKWATAAALFLAISKFHGYISILSVIRTPMILSIIALIAMFSQTSRWRPADLQRHWIPKLVGVILLISIAGIPFSIYKSQSLTTFNEVFSRTLLLATITWGVSRTRQGLEFMTGTVLLSCVTAALLAFALGRTDSTGRLAGGYAYDPNDIALIGVVGIPLALWWALTPGKPLRGLMLLAIPLFVQLIVKSDSRGGFLAMISVIVAFFSMSMTKAHKKLKYTGWVIGAAAVGSFVLAPGYFIEKYQSIMDPKDYNRTSATGRKQVWARGIGYAMSNPIFGVGIGNFGSAEGRSQTGDAVQAAGRGWKWGTAHNSFVQIGAELGLIAGVAFIMLFFRSIRELIALGKAASARGDLLAPFLGMSLVGFASSAFFLSWGYYDLTYALLALAAAILMQQRDLQPSRPSNSGPRAR